MEKTHSLLLTCQSGLESLVRREWEKLGLENTTGQDRIVEWTWDLATMMRLCMGSRFASRVYINLASKKITDFDELFALIAHIRWDEYLDPALPLIIDASSTRSALSSAPTLQSLGEKAIKDTFPGMWWSGKKNDKEIHVLILVIDDMARILLDVTGEALHKRGYRTEQGEAPIKETLAAGLVAMSGWRYKEPMWDPCCGSGTLAIEAALMARNIAPGLERDFRFMDLPFYDRMAHMEVKKNLRDKEFTWTYTILASDMDDNMVAIAKRNALRAWVRDSIHFETVNFHEDDMTARWTIVSNPPYGNRLKDDNLHELYKKLIHEVEENGGGFITSYHIDIRHGLANRKLLNGSEECRFWYKKNK